MFQTQVGRHVGLFDEGVAIHYGQAVAADKGWWDRPCDEWARDAINDGRLPPLREIVTPEHFYDHPWSVVGGVFYPSGCSFVAHLVRAHGREAMLAFMRAVSCETQDDPGTVISVFQRAFGVSLDGADAEWRAALRTSAFDNR